MVRKISPQGIWYAGVYHWGDAFADDVGDLFQQYVGRLLSTIPDAQVYPEIVYAKGQNRSVDWIVVWDNVVLLVEVKAARSTEDIRKGTPEAWGDLCKKLGHAHDQISKTDERIAQRHPRFSHIPHNLPRIGLILTMDPFPFMNAGMIRSMVGASPAIPTRGCSSNVLEWLVRLKDRSVGEYLVDLMNDPSKEGWELDSDLLGSRLALTPCSNRCGAATGGAPGPQREARKVPFDSVISHSAATIASRIWFIRECRQSTTSFVGVNAGRPRSPAKDPHGRYPAATSPFAGYLVDLAAPGADRLLSVFVSDQSTRVACISQNGAYARPFVSHGSIRRNPSTKGLNCSALSGLRAINMSKDSMLMLT